MNIAQHMTMLLAQALPQTDNNIVIHEVSSNIKGNKTAERTFAVFGKVDGEFVLIFVFYVTEYFVDGIVHLELVDSIQYYNEINRTELCHTILLSYFYSCSLRGLKWTCFQSCPLGDDSCVFHVPHGSRSDSPHASRHETLTTRALHPPILEKRVIHHVQFRMGVEVMAHTHLDMRH